jgi:cytochrome P450
MSAFTVQNAKRATALDRWVSFNSRPVAISALYLLTRISRVLKVPGLGLLVSDAGVMRQILMDGEHFSKTAPGGTSDLWDPVLRGPGLLNMSGEEHLDLKRKLTPLFSAKYLEDAIGAAVRGETDRLAARLLNGEAVDIVKSIEVTAARVICTLSGYDLENTEESAVLEQLERARGLMRFVKLTTKRLSDEQAEIAKRELADLHRSIHEAFDSDRAGTIPNTLKGFGLSKHDTTSVITALVIAGTETVLSHLPRFTALLLRSGYLGELDSESDLDAVVQEGLRVTVPTPVMLRGLKSPHQVQGRKVKPGDRVMLATIFA